MNDYSKRFRYALHLHMQTSNKCDSQVMLCQCFLRESSFSENTSLGSIKEKNACTGSVDEPETRHPLLKFAPRLP